MAGRLSWGLADQAVSSVTNFTVGAVAARSLGTTAFGSFTVAFVTYILVLNLARGLATDPLTVRFSGVSDDTWRGAVSRCSGAALLVGVVGGGIVVLVGLALGDEVGSGLVALGLTLPGLMLQDSWRFAFFAAGRGRHAVANDLVWAAALVPALILAIRDASVFGFVLAWGLAGTLAGIFGLLQTRVALRPSKAWEWLTQQRDLGVRYLAANVCVGVGEQLRMYGLGGISGLAGVGAFRGAGLLFGPFNAVLMGLALATVPEAVRALQRSTRRLSQFCLLVNGVVMAAALCWGLVLLLLPERVGRFVMGDVWTAASPLLVPVTLEVVIMVASVGASTGLRALGAARRTLRAQFVASAVRVVVPLVAAVAAGVLGFAWGSVVASVVASVVWWSQYRRGLEEHAALAADQLPTPTEVLEIAVDKEEMR